MEFNECESGLEYDEEVEAEGNAGRTSIDD